MSLMTPVCRNVVVNGRRTSLRLEAEVWDAVDEICRREELALNVFCSFLETRQDGVANLSSAIRMFVLTYFRSAATERGHVDAGHGFDELNDELVEVVDVA